MQDEGKKAAILDAVDAAFDDQVEFTRDLVRFPSQRGQEHTAQDFMYEAMRKRGLTMDRWTIDIDAIRDHPGFSPVSISYDNVWNVVGTHRPKETTGRSLILNGHIDVVPAGPLDMWTSPPYDPKVENGWLYGRGSGDMKAGLGAMVYAYDALKAAGLEPAAPVYFQSVTEEECTGNGALACLRRGYHADAALIPEPTGDALTRANVGVLWFQVEVRGRPAHVARANTGANAIVATYRIIEALQALENKWNAAKADHRHFEDVEKPININVGKIAGGDWASSVPAWCKIDVRAAIYPGVKVADAQAEIEACVAKAAHDDPYLSNHPPTVTYNGFTSEGYRLDEGGEAEQVLHAAHEQVYAAALESRTATAYLDARVFVLYDDTPALVYGPVSEHVHGFDERVNLESVRHVTKSIALFMADWCGTAPA
ncbi:MAG: ArgE/DapE family deacylase [Minwuiales bacterium]|nr:ArgE/DapE family deacylase [Minwuiales bacterium]